MIRKSFLIYSIVNNILVGIISFIGIQTLIISVEKYKDFVCRIDSIAETLGSILRFIMIFSIEKIPYEYLRHIYSYSSVILFFTTFIYIVLFNVQTTYKEYILFLSWILNRLSTSCISAFRDNNVYKLISLNIGYNGLFIKTIKNSSVIIFWLYIRFISLLSYTSFVLYSVIGFINIFISNINFNNSRFLYENNLDTNVNLYNVQHNSFINILIKSFVQILQSVSTKSILKVTLYSLLLSIFMPSQSFMYTIYDPNKIVFYKSIGQCIIVPIVSLFVNYRIIMLLMPFMCSAYYLLILLNISSVIDCQKLIFVMFGYCVGIKNINFLLISKCISSYSQFYPAYSLLIDNIGCLFCSFVYELLKQNISEHISFQTMIFISLVSGILICFVDLFLFKRRES